MQTTMSEKIGSLKTSFVREAQAEGLPSRGLRAIFVIGSAANEQSFSNEFFQDFDIHLFFDRLDIHEETLKRIKALFQRIAFQHADEHTAVEFAIMDRPWKMISSRPRNIGIHGTLLNSLDFRRRVERNYILGLNMFQTSEVLYGQIVFPQRTISPGQFLSEVGGIGWLMEQYCRVLPLIDIQNEAMYPMMAELSYYFGLSPLLHFYYVHKGRAATRKECFSFFINNETVPEDLKEAAQFIREKSISGPESCQKMLNCVFKIMQFVSYQIRERSEKEVQVFPAEKILVVDEDSDLIAEILGRPVSVVQKHFLISCVDFDEARREIRKHFCSSLCSVSDDFVESIGDLVEKGERAQVERSYFWVSGRNERFFNRIDFPLSNPTLDSLLYSWEKGVTTFIQRLLERYLGKEKLESTDILLARLLTLIAYSCYQRTVGSKDSALSVLNQELEKNGGLKGVDSLTIEDEYFAYLRALYSLAEKIIKQIKQA